MPAPSLIIAISRQRGSGGAAVGRRIADEVKLRYIDRQLLRHAAEFLQSQDERAGAAATSGSWWSRLGEAMGMASGGFNHVPPALPALHESQLLGVEERLLNEIADHGRAVIVGCGAAQMLKGRPRVFSAFLHAPVDWRAARLCELYGLDARAAQQAIQDADRNRARFVEQLTGGPWTRSGCYDITLDTSTMGVAAAAGLILAAAKEKLEVRSEQ